MADRVARGGAPRGFVPRGCVVRSVAAALGFHVTEGRDGAMTKSARIFAFASPQGAPDDDAPADHIASITASWATKITQAWRETVPGIIKVGRMLIDAREA